MNEEAEKLPDVFEEVITDVNRIKYLLREYLTRPSICIRARDEKFAQLYSDPFGHVWGMVIPELEPEIFQLPYLKRCRSYLVGDDNLEVKQPVL